MAFDHKRTPNFTYVCPNCGFQITKRLDFERFWERVDTQSGPCWNWLGGVSSFGQGRFRLGTRAEGMVLAYRFAWEDIMGPIPAQKLVLHKCDNPRCVNPQHLFIGTYKDNMQDMVRKGRHRGGRPRRDKLGGD